MISLPRALAYSVNGLTPSEKRVERIGDREAAPPPTMVFASIGKGSASRISDDVGVATSGLCDVSGTAFNLALDYA